MQITIVAMNVADNLCDVETRESSNVVMFDTFILRYYN